jgi:hypothetical protein
VATEEDDDAPEQSNARSLAVLPPPLGLDAGHVVDLRAGALDACTFGG